MRQENMLPPQEEGEAVAIGSTLIRVCENAIATLGEGGAKPLPPVEIKRMHEQVGATGARDPFRPVLLGNALLDWSEARAIGLHDLKSMLPIHEVLMGYYIDALLGMGAKEIPRGMLVKAGHDRRLLDTLEDVLLRERFITSRLQSLGDYTERKLYALSLGVMAYQE